jgi:hypothetical protein
MSGVFDTGKTRTILRLVAKQSQHYLPRYSRGGQIGFDTVTIIGKVEYIAFILNRGREGAGLGIQRHQRYYIRVVVGLKPLSNAGRRYQWDSQVLLRKIAYCSSCPLYTVSRRRNQPILAGRC